MSNTGSPYYVSVTNDEDNDCRYVLRIWRNGSVIQEEYDAGEPEDNLFCRDYAWIQGALERAYQLGLEDGKSGA